MKDHREISEGARLPADPKVSVVVVTYNHAGCLAQAIDSIAAQRTSFPFEIIIAEDCSTDGTLAVAQSLQRKYPHLVRVVATSANKGMNRNLRFGLSLARASYIALCDGDDFWIDPLKLERQVRMLDEAPQVDMAISRGMLVYPDGRQVAKPEWDYGPEQRVVPAPELFSGFAWVAPTTSLVWRSQVTGNLPAWLDEAPFADMPLLIAGSARGGVIYDPHATVAYRIAHPSSFTVRLRDTPPEQRADYARRAKALLCSACDHYGMPRAYLSHRINDYQLQLVRELVRAGGWMSACREALRLSPSFILRGAARRLARLAGRAPQPAAKSSV